MGKNLFSWGTPCVKKRKVLQRGGRKGSDLGRKEVEEFDRRFSAGKERNPWAGGGKKEWEKKRELIEGGGGAPGKRV